MNGLAGDGNIDGKSLLLLGLQIFFFFVIIVLVFAIDNRIVIWILIVIESACYLGILFVRRRIRQLQR